MAEPFLCLPREERSQIFQTLAPRLGLSPVVLQKDVWVCWVLEKLFLMPGRLPMAFKGGTSLSKVYGVIHRFSEDVDITLDFRSLSPECDPYAQTLSRTKLKKLGEELKSLIQRHAHEIIHPYLADLIQELAPEGGARVATSEDGESIRVYYASATGDASTYVTDSVLVELGGRNVTEPCEEHQVETFLAGSLDGLALPCARVVVLSPLRTFWEKATLIHVECHRKDLKSKADRLSRHWYDLALLAQHHIGEQALLRRDLLEQVVAHKKIFFNSSYACYDDCLAGRLQLIPEGSLLQGLEKDYEQMKKAGMFYTAPPSFETLIEQLRRTQSTVNSSRG